MEETLEKRRKNSNGITLIALVVTIIVLLILAGVTIGTLTSDNGVIKEANSAKEQAEKSGLEEQVELAIIKAEQKYRNPTIDQVIEEIKNNGVISNSNQVDKKTGAITSDLGYVIEGKLDNYISVESWNEAKGVNTPRLTEGMIPIKWENNNWVICSEEDENWYNYVDQGNGTDGTNKWANVMLSDGRYKVGMQEAKEGQVVAKEDLGSMFVWIPRYAYEIESGYHKSTAGKINIAFLEGKKIYNIGDEISYTSQGTKGTARLANASGEGNWNEHLAFNYGGRIISGIWVAKFEASSTNPNEENGGGNVTNLKVKVLPTVTSWRYITIGNSYINCINMNSTENASYYGISSNDNIIDPHLLKNNEWGAVAYLAQSSYGRNGNEITINNSSLFITGSAGNGVNVGIDVGTTNDYTNSQGVLASTTGNTTGIYDMNGGAWDRVAGYVNNGDANLSKNGQALIDAPERHKQVYAAITLSGTVATVGNDDQEKNYNSLKNVYGDALYETSSIHNGTSGSWYENYFRYPYSENPFLARGGEPGTGALAGNYCLAYTLGGASNTNSFRPSIVIF